MDDVSLRRLRYFKTLSETLHFGRAAELLHISQPALSVEIRKLETQLKVALFVRAPKPALTAEGEVLLRHATTLLSAADRFSAHGRALAHGSAVRIVVGTVPTLLHQGLPQVIASLKGSAPHISIGIRELSSSDSLTAMRQGDVDIALTNLAPDSPELSGERVRLDRFVLAVPAAWDPELAVTEIADLTGSPFVTFRRKASPLYHDRIMDVFHSLGFEPDIVHETSTWDGVIRLVSQGLGAAVIPENLTRHTENADRIHHVELPDNDIRSETWISRTSEGQNSMVGYVYSEILRGLANDH